MWTMTTLVSATSVFSVFANFFVIYIILRHSYFIGWYKYILAAYCFHEAVCAFIIATVAPVHFVYDNTYIIFTSGPLVEGTDLGKYGSGIYCGLLLMWMSFTLYQFLYRYMVVCHHLLYKRIVQSCYLKSFIILAAIAYPTYLLICGSYWCLLAEIPENNDGTISVFGTLSTVNHYFAHSTTTMGVIFCTVSIYRKLTIGLGVVNVKKQAKLFRLLLAQSLIPLFCFEAPASLYITFPLWAKDNTFGYTAPVMTCLLSMPKLLDPIVITLFITEYRKAVWEMLTRKRCGDNTVKAVSDSKGPSFKESEGTM